MKSSSITKLALSFTATLAGVFGVVAIASADSFFQDAPVANVVQPSYALDSNPLFVTAITSTSDGNVVATTKGDKRVTLYNGDMTKKVKSWEVADVPSGVVVKDGKAYVTLEAGGLCVIDLNSDTVGEPITLNLGSREPIVTADAIYVLEQFTNSVAKIDPKTMTVVSRAQVRREPKGAALTKDGKYLLVVNFLPDQRADLDHVAADLSIVNVQTMEVEKNLNFANGSNALRGVTISEDGKYAFVSHNLGRFAVPTSQLQQGWMNTSAMSVIDVEKQEYIGAVILDEPDRGAAGIWDIKEVAGKIIVSHSGTHDVSVIDYQAFIDKLKNYPGDVETLAYDLQFLYGLRHRLPVVGNGPRVMAVNGDKLIVPTYFADTVNIINFTNDNPVVEKIVPMVANRKESLIQQGEKIFNDAQYCFQQWQSCNGCHPGDGRTDGMNWDLMNDGIGNPKNCKSLLYSIQTPPSMISGIRENAKIANRKGFTHIQFYEIPENLAVAVDAYTMSLEALSSPYLVNGQLSDQAKAGKKVFEKLGCQECHSGPYFTDLRQHRIGENVEFEKGWDTPTLREVWRTAPYLFDGRAQTMFDVFAVYKHGIDKKVSTKELEQLTQYVLSL